MQVQYHTERLPDLHMGSHQLPANTVNVMVRTTHPLCTCAGLKEERLQLFSACEAPEKHDSTGSKRTSPLVDCMETTLLPFASRISLSATQGSTKFRGDPASSSTNSFWRSYRF